MPFPVLPPSTLLHRAQQADGVSGQRALQVAATMVEARGKERLGKMCSCEVRVEEAA
jgi:hypothetical protein